MALTPIRFEQFNPLSIKSFGSDYTNAAKNFQDFAKYAREEADRQRALATQRILAKGDPNALQRAAQVGDVGLLQKLQQNELTQEETRGNIAAGALERAGKRTANTKAAEELKLFQEFGRDEKEAELARTKAQTGQAEAAATLSRTNTALRNFQLTGLQKDKLLKEQGDAVDVYLASAPEEIKNLSAPELEAHLIEQGYNPRAIGFSSAGQHITKIKDNLLKIEYERAKKAGQTPVASLSNPDNVASSQGQALLGAAWRNADDPLNNDIRTTLKTNVVKTPTGYALASNYPASAYVTNNARAHDLINDFPELVTALDMNHIYSAKDLSDAQKKVYDKLAQLQTDTSPDYLRDRVAQIAASTTENDGKLNWKDFAKALDKDINDIKTERATGKAAKGEKALTEAGKEDSSPETPASPNSIAAAAAAIGVPVAGSFAGNRRGVGTASSGVNTGSGREVEEALTAVGQGAVNYANRARDRRGEERILRR